MVIEYSETVKGRNSDMDHTMGTLLIILACMVVLLIGAVRKKIEWLLNIVMRSVLGTLAIFFMDMVFNFFGVSIGVGINAVTVLTSGILGFPGLVALYGIGIYKML